MTTDQPLETESGALRRLLAAAVGFVLALLGLTLAAGPAAAGNVVGAQPVFSISSVGPHGTAGQETTGVRGPPQLQLVSATGVAAEEGSVAGRAASAAKSCLNSFTADTPVTMADGSKKPISKVKVGDKVLATDPETGQTKAEPVVQLIRHSGQHAMVLISLGDGSVLDSTDGHPIWDATTGQFTDASKLHAGDKIETTSGHLLTITKLTTYSADLTAYNLQIDQIHTYYAGATPVLVHNSCGIPADGSSMSVDDALTQGERWLGGGYTEAVPGSGRYVSSDGTRVFRMGDSDILGAHGGGSHVNFEELVPNPARPGRLMVGTNSHVYLTDW